MAKEIKAIKCPNCGSVDKVALRPDFYKCNSCQTEYFLDDNDVNINYNHNYNQNNPFGNNNDKTLKVVGIVIGCVFGFLVLSGIISSIFSSSKKSNTHSTYSAPTVKEPEEIDQSYSASRYTNLTFIQPSTQKPIVLMLESRRYRDHSNEAKEGTYLAYYDATDKKLLAEEKISNESHSSSDLEFKTFSDGNAYAVYDKKSFQMLDKEHLKMVDVGKTFFEANNELQIGVATLEFVYDDKGDGLILFTNDGKKRFYYPLIQKLYTEKEFYTASQGFNTLLPNSKAKSLYFFTRVGSEYPEEKIQLIQYHYKDNGAGPKDLLDFISWGKDYGRSGIFTGGEPYKKVLIGDYNKQNARVTSFKDLTPGRLYFYPSIELFDGENLIIQFRANASKESAINLQKLNTENGSVEWTMALPKNITIESLIKYKDGFAGVNSEDEIFLLDNKGNIKSTYKLD